MKIKLLFIIFCGLISLVLFGCKHDNKIKFYRESTVNSAIEELKQSFPKKDTVTKSSGIVIYKDNTTAQDKDNTQSANFGPKDLDFDLPVKF